MQVRALEAEVEQLKKKAGGLSKERLLREKAIKKLQAQKDKKVRSLEGSGEGGREMLMKGGRNNGKQGGRRQERREVAGVCNEEVSRLHQSLWLPSRMQSPAALSAKEEMSRIQRRIRPARRRRRP